MSLEIGLPQKCIYQGVESKLVKGLHCRDKCTAPGVSLIQHDGNQGVIGVFIIGQFSYHGTTTHNSLIVPQNENDRGH